MDLVVLVQPLIHVAGDSAGKHRRGESGVSASRSHATCVAPENYLRLGGLSCCWAIIAAAPGTHGRGSSVGHGRGPSVEVVCGGH